MMKLKFDKFFVNLKDTLDKETESLLIELFEWMFYDTQEYKDIIEVSIIDKTFLAVNFRGELRSRKYPLFGAIYAQLIPHLLDEFDIVYATSPTKYLESPLLRELRDNPKEIYTYFFYNDLLPLHYIKALFNYAVTGENIEKYTEENKKNYTYNAEME